MKKCYGRGPSNGMDLRLSQPHRRPHWREPQMCRQKGFSLIELLFLGAIGTMSAAVGALRTLNTAQISYNSTYGTVGFAGTLSYLAGTTCATVAPTSANACLIDSALGSGTKSGYK